MIVWKIQTDKTEFFAEKSTAKITLRAHREGKKKSDDDWGDGPEKVSVSNREELAWILNSVTGE